MAQTEEKNIVNLFYSFVDEAFDIANGSAYQLVLQISTQSLSVTVNEKQKNKFIALEVFHFQNVYSFTEVVSAWDEIVKKSKLLSDNYKSVICIIVNSNSTLVPDPLYEEGSERMYLKFNVALQWNEFVMKDHIKSIEAKNIFAVPLEIKSKLDAVFHTVHYRHYSSILIENVITQNKNKIEKKLYVHVQQTHFEALVIEGKKLLFYNTFSFQTPEDFIYFLLFVLEQLQLNPEKTEVILVGEIERNAEIIQLIQKYIRIVKFGERFSDAALGYQLQTLPHYFYYTLFSNSLSLI